MRQRRLAKTFNPRARRAHARPFAFPGAVIPVRWWILPAALLASCLILTWPAHAASANQTQPTKIKKLMKQVSGKVTGAHAGTLTLVYKKTETTEFEIVLPVAKDAQFEHLKGLSEVQPGDVVRVKYEEVTEHPGEPGERSYLRAKAVSLVKRLSQSAKQSLEAAAHE